MQEPFQVMLDIIELRAYANAKHAIDNAADEAKLPDTPMVQWVRQIEGQILQEQVARRAMSRQERKQRAEQKQQEDWGHG